MDNDIIEEEVKIRLIDQANEITAGDRESVRESYKVLASLAHSIAFEGDTSALDMDAVKKGLEDSTEVFSSGHVMLPREAAADAEVLKQYSEIIRKKVLNQRDAMVEFDSSKFATHLVSVMKMFDKNNTRSDGDPTLTQWAELGRTVSSCFRRAPAFHSLYDGFHVDEEQRAVAAQSQAAKKSAPKQEKVRLKNEIVPVTQPKAVKSVAEVGESEETAKMVNDVWKTLRMIIEQNDGEPVSYFEFVLDPKSFVQSIENMFYVSFLVKSGQVGIRLDDAGLPVLSIYEVGETVANGGNSGQGSSGHCNQCIMTMNMETWRELIDAYEIEEAVLTFSR